MQIPSGRRVPLIVNLWNYLEDVTLLLLLAHLAPHATPLLANICKESTCRSVRRMTKREGVGASSNDSKKVSSYFYSSSMLLSFRSITELELEEGACRFWSELQQID